MSIDPGWPDRPDGTPYTLIAVDRSILLHESPAAVLAVALLRNRQAEVRMILDALLEAGVEPDGDEPVTDEWLEQEFGFVIYHQAVKHRVGDAFERKVFDRHAQGIYQHGSIFIRKRRDARDIVRIGKYYDIATINGNRPVNPPE